MAAFTDQFSRFDPLKFESYGKFDLMIAWFASEARALLTPGRTVEQLTVIAQEVEAFISSRIPNERRVAVTLDDLMVVKDMDHPMDLSGRLPFPVKLWEPHIVFSLWNLIDALVMSGYPEDKPNSDFAILMINASIISATSAIQVAYRIAGTRSGVTTNILDEFNRRSNAARESVQFRWQEVREHKRFALDLAPKFKLKSRMAVARAINDDLQVRFRTTYSDDTVDGWLKEANWSKTI